MLQREAEAPAAPCRIRSIIGVRFQTGLVGCVEELQWLGEADKPLVMGEALKRGN
jgi:hypothetical protein